MDELSLDQKISVKIVSGIPLRSTPDTILTDTLAFKDPKDLHYWGGSILTFFLLFFSYYPLIQHF